MWAMNLSVDGPPPRFTITSTRAWAGVDGRGDDTDSGAAAARIIGPPGSSSADILPFTPGTDSCTEMYAHEDVLSNQRYWHSDTVTTAAMPPASSTMPTAGGAPGLEQVSTANLIALMGALSGAGVLGRGGTDCPIGAAAASAGHHSASRSAAGASRDSPPLAAAASSRGTDCAAAAAAAAAGAAARQAHAAVPSSSKRPRSGEVPAVHDGGCCWAAPVGGGGEPQQTSSGGGWLPAPPPRSQQQSQCTLAAAAGHGDQQQWAAPGGRRHGRADNRDDQHPQPQPRHAQPAAGMAPAAAAEWHAGGTHAPAADSSCCTGSSRSHLSSAAHDMSVALSASHGGPSGPVLAHVRSHCPPPQCQQQDEVWIAPSRGASPRAAGAAAAAAAIGRQLWTAAGAGAGAGAGGYASCGATAEAPPSGRMCGAAHDAGGGHAVAVSAARVSSNGSTLAYGGRVSGGGGGGYGGGGGWPHSPARATGRDTHSVPHTSSHDNNAYCHHQQQQQPMHPQGPPCDVQAMSWVQRAGGRTQMVTSSPLATQEDGGDRWHQHQHHLHQQQQHQHHLHHHQQQQQQAEPRAAAELADPAAASGGSAPPAPPPPPPAPSSGGLCAGLPAVVEELLHQVDTVPRGHMESQEELSAAASSATTASSSSSSSGP
ncbi:hypothetical protein HYH02_010471 [Chlamydomonas schloesseri]|uniref:Uncharacterized protein n=1 Tax=Chlamydomonas schloesseri TaxID=2026947 RepID=A0A835T6W7_9CHLO|nr:hypothetical protein HYH02_010471 [Chlamydomonas schloesseri]|eukprot:KAG2439838.1 hypothetical protein HYH02_010471 [Chlamydomonas schloesseri]